MAEQSSRDVVDQTLSGGEPSPSDVPASTTDKTSAGGDVGKHIAQLPESQILSEQKSNDVTTETTESQGKRTGGDKDTGGSLMVGIVDGKEENSRLNWLQDPSKQGVGLVASRALELNGLASASDGGDDTASQGGSESDTSRTDGRHHTRTGSVKKPSMFKPMSFTKFTMPKAPGAPPPLKAPEKGLFVYLSIVARV
ncbi:ATPase F0 complex subunit F mitochondria [Penicillium verhagenii]|uniref:ATPase F0 complex subunit F mitochondria n=1 Tax=Penicillium verhagenii TaxID=1562060 RepID=UPI00254556A1|nr:ATPase F0 complex subunit F mitochondria [Penicillium verhagenii]KAJ5934483.1 ATPase F0 complex subunit F mitochondria [Penicillium verhagenii]